MSGGEIRDTPRVVRLPPACYVSGAMDAAVKPIDCDVHPTVPGIEALLPYLEPFWRDQVADRGIEGLDNVAYPPNAPISARPDFRNPGARPASDVGTLARPGARPLGRAFAICNCLYGVQLPFNEDMARAFARAVNDWIAREWLDRDPRLRASIVVPLQNVEFAVDEIERLRRRPALRPGAGAGHGRDAARTAAFLADLCRGGAPRPADRHSRRQRLSPSRHLARLAELLCRGLLRPVPGFPGPGREPHQRRRVRQASRAQGGADRVRRELGAGLPVAAREVLARPAHRDPLDRPLAARDLPRPFPPDPAAVRCAR